MLVTSPCRTIVAPMLNVTSSSAYSNFWCGMDEQVTTTVQYKVIYFVYCRGFIQYVYIFVLCLYYMKILPTLILELILL